MIDLPRLMLLGLGGVLAVMIIYVVTKYITRPGDKPHAGHVTTVSASYVLLLLDVMHNVFERIGIQQAGVFYIRLFAVSLGLTAMAILIQYYATHKKPQD